MIHTCQMMRDFALLVVIFRKCLKTPTEKSEGPPHFDSLPAKSQEAKIARKQRPGNEFASVRFNYATDLECASRSKFLRPTIKFSSKAQEVRTIASGGYTKQLHTLHSHSCMNWAHRQTHNGLRTHLNE
ncbi:hypothetical protein CLF_107346 [Clonorchis sinensis]|uniref:Uncharacterized protein n=1 Tax=Clonorchis sinensis TaxID=79923 RepID=G7YQJ4_CLOSI|nr:hypothetical protein CLF_107346 [Clonorchis sinensis]